MVTVSATVTNTGQVAGADVAQLYLGDPAAAGEPPRQLKGFQKVTLAARPVDDRALHAQRPRPVVLERRGQRLGRPRRPVRRLRRRLLGAGQPAAARRASRSSAAVGARYATVQAPTTIDAGGTATVTANARQRRRLRDARRRSSTLKAPGRLDGEQPGAGHHRAGPDGHRALPRDRARGRDSPATSTLTAGSPRWPASRAATALVQASTTVVVPYTSLAAAVQQHRDQRQLQRGRRQLRRRRRQLLGAGAGGGHADRAHARAARSRSAGPPSPGPTSRPARPDNVVTAGQTVDAVRLRNRSRLPRRQPERHRERNRHRQLHRRQRASHSTSTWPTGTPTRRPSATSSPTTTSSWNFQQNSIGPHPVSIYFALGAARAGQDGGVGHAADPEQRRRDHRDAHLRDGHREPEPRRSGAPFSSLAAAYDNAGISDNSNPAAADFDGTGESFSAQALAAGTPTPLTRRRPGDPRRDDRSPGRAPSARPTT